jgi:hypothetical protein
MLLAEPSTDWVIGLAIEVTAIGVTTRFVQNRTLRMTPAKNGKRAPPIS